MIHCKLNSKVKFDVYFADVKVGSKIVDPENNVPVVPISLGNTDTLFGTVKVNARDMNGNELDTYEKIFSGPEVSITAYHYGSSWEDNVGALIIEEIHVNNSEDFLLPVKDIVAEMNDQIVEGHADSIIKPDEEDWVEIYDIRFEDMNKTKNYQLEISIYFVGEFLYNRTFDINRLGEYQYTQ
ncbi:MAG: hypothetical protein ACOC85_02360 [Thermoplasmatota archaeon]